jgi:hypothetical protein
MMEYIGVMSDEEMAADRWENEGGRTSTKRTYSSLEKDVLQAGCPCW